MIDLITQLQLKDGLAAHSLVFGRVSEVARAVGRITRDLENWEGKCWVLESFSIDMRESYPDGMQHQIKMQVQARFRLEFEARPITVKYGDPRDDESDEYSRQPDITRTVRFPRRYLLTNGWEAEVEEAAAANQRWWAGYHAEQLAERITGVEAELVKMKARLNELRQKSLK
jgi:hypothetical protein